MTAVTPSCAVRRPAALRRSWMFAPGLPTAQQSAAIAAQPDVLVFDLEEFTAPADRPAARAHLAQLLPQCKAQGFVVAVRINRLDDGGLEDLQGIMPGAPDAVLLPFTESAAHMHALSQALQAQEQRCQLRVGQTEIVPTLETALAIVRMPEILTADARITASLLAVEDLSADLQAMRSPQGTELAYVRSRFLLECRAFNVEPIDCPFNYRDAAAAQQDLQWAWQLGFRSKCVTHAHHVAPVHERLTPQPEACAQAQSVVAQWALQKQGALPAAVALVDSPMVSSAQRVLSRQAQFAAWNAQVAAALAGAQA